VRPTISVTPVSQVSCAHTTWRHGEASRVTIIAKATFRLVHESAATLIEPDAIRPNGHELAPYLPGAGVLLEGHARAAGGSKVSSMSVRLAVYRQQAAVLDKTIHVYGDRGAPPSAEPLPFTEMPLSWERARRGGGDNPTGRDAPNLVDPANPRRPACFAPLSPEWPSRRRLFGAAEPATLALPYAEVPAGFDWRALHAAPSDQIIGLLAGDEWIVLDGMHATRPRLQTQLPGFRGAARWHTARQGELGPANALALSGDLLLIDADRQTCSVVWRGSFGLPDACERLQVFVGTHQADASIDWPSQVPRRPKPETAVLSARSNIGPESLPFVAPTGPRPAIVDMPPPEAGDSASASRKPGATMPPTSGAPHSLPFQAPPVSNPPTAPPAVIVDEPSIVTSPDSGFPSAVVEPEGEAINDSVEPEGEAINDSEARRTVIAKLEAGDSLSNDSYPNADLRGLDLSGRMMSGCNLTGADLRGATLTGARLQDAKLTSADLTGVDLSGADLARVDARKAHLDGARLEGATLTSADFSLSHGKNVHAANITGRHLRLIQADWSGADLSKANLPDVDFGGARVDGATFDGANLADCRMNDLKGAACSFAGANISRAHFGGASLVGANLKGATAAGATFDNADLEEADFSSDMLRELSLVRARLTRSVFAGADMTKANLRHVTGEQTSFREARLDEADLRQARLSGATFDRASLGGATAVRADLSQSRLVDADLAKACLRPARLVGCDLSRAKVAGADFRDADLTGANLFGVDRSSAKLAGAKLRDVVEREPASQGADGAS